MDLVRRTGRDIVHCATLVPHAVRQRSLLTLLLGITALVPLGLLLLFVLRGVLYGLVDQGPYDHSWGGPSRAGAWAVHLLVSIPFAIASAAALTGLATLHRRLPARSAVTLTLLVPLPAIAFVTAWLHQL